MKSWFSIENKADAPAAKIFIYEEIGFFGIRAIDFLKAVNAIPDDREIELHCHCPGGSVLEGMVIHDAIARMKNRITGFVDGTCASMITPILCACKKVIMAANGWFMIHEVQGGADGKADDVETSAKIIRTLNETIVSIYATKTGKSPEEIRALMAKGDLGTWFTAEEAKAFGFVDEISEAVDMTAKTDFFDRFQNGPKSVGAPKPEEKTPSNPQDTKMKLLLAALAAASFIPSADCSEEDAVKAFNAAHKKASDDMANLRTQVENITNERKAVVKNAGEAFIAQAVKDGKIKDDPKLRAKWLENYISDATGTQELVNGMEAPKRERGAPPVPDTKGDDKDQKLTGLARTQAAFLAKLKARKQ